MIESLLEGRECSIKPENSRQLEERYMQRLYPIEVKDSKLEHEDTNEFPITFVERANAENMD